MSPIINSVNSKDFIELKEKAEKSDKKRERICLHQDHGSSIQQMLISLYSDSWIPVHKQVKQTESFVLIEGKIKVLFFNECGEITSSYSLSNDSLRIIHFNANIWHTCIALSPFASFFEITEGPYNSHNTIWASWSDFENPKEEYLKRLRDA